MGKKKNISVKKLSFLSERKNINDKFFDLVNEHISAVPYFVKGKEKWKQVGSKKLAGELEISIATLNKSIKQGFINPKNEILYINVERNFDKLKKSKKTKPVTNYLGIGKHQLITDFKNVTKQFTVHTFTFDNFFKRKPFGRIGKNEQLYFKAGLYMVFRSGKTGTYTIQNLPLSHHSNLYPQGYNEFFEIIKAKLQDYPSLKFFRFNYFDVQKIDLGSIDERVAVFQNKNKQKVKTKKSKTNAKRKNK